METIKELYEKYKGFNAYYCGFSGVIVGYREDAGRLIAACNGTGGWYDLDEQDILPEYVDNGEITTFSYVSESQIIHKS